MAICINRDGKCDPECLIEEGASKCIISAENDSRCTITGIQRLNNKRYNKGLAFTIEERIFLGIHGLMPPLVQTPQQQIQQCLLQLRSMSRDLDKYTYLMNLADRNEHLFYQLLRTDILKFVKLIYTPTVAEACKKFGLIYMAPRGLYINIQDKGHVYERLREWPERYVRIIVLTDGERVVGFGDLGAHGMGIVIGKAVLYTALGCIRPEVCLPIMLDCGTNTSSLIIDPMYIGIREERGCPCVYEEFIDEFMDAAGRLFGRTVLFHFEDFASKNAFHFLDKYQKKFCVINSDIQATAAAVLAGILVALKVTNKPPTTQKIFFLTAGEACIEIARLYQSAVMRSGATEAEAKELIWLCDTKGLIVEDRRTDGLSDLLLEFAQPCDPIVSLYEAIEKVQPNILVGVASQPGAFTPNILRLMAEINERPIIFALSTPPAKSECVPKYTYGYTNGKCLFASGSPYPPFTYGRKLYHTGQSSSLQIFPGIALGCLCSGMLRIPSEVFLIAAETLAETVTSEDIEKGSLYPSLTKYMCTSVEIARWVMEYAYRYNLATVFPEPCNKHEFIKSQMYDPNYQPIIPQVYLEDEIW